MIGLEMIEPMMVRIVMMEVLRKYCQKGMYSTASRKFDQVELARPEDGRIGHQILPRS